MNNESEIERLKVALAEKDARLAEIKSIVINDEPLGLMIEQLFYAPLRAAEAEVAALKREIEQLESQDIQMREAIATLKREIGKRDARIEDLEAGNEAALMKARVLINEVEVEPR